MSYLVGAERARTDDDRLKAGQDHTTQDGGQRHDRISVAQQDTMASGGTEITIAQRMVSASAGSFLTSLLGTALLLLHLPLLMDSQ